MNYTVLESGSAITGVWMEMTDPRNVAHKKKVKQEKKHDKPAAAEHAREKESAPAAADTTKTEQEPGALEKTIAVLSKLKEMEFHSRGNIETLAGLTLTIEEELKQKEFSEPIGAVYSAQDNFQSAITSLIENYQATCDSLKSTT